IPSKLTVLTSIGYDHTEWLGETLEEIASEKLAVLLDHTTLIVGEVAPELERVVQREVERKHSHVVRVSEASTGGPVTYRDRNEALAEAAAQQILGRLDPDAIAALAEFTIPGRAEVVRDEPDIIYDAAHNRDGALALAE